MGHTHMHIHAHTHTHQFIQSTLMQPACFGVIECVCVINVITGDSDDVGKVLSLQELVL